MGINLSEVAFAYYVPKNIKKAINFALQDININIQSNDEFIALVGHTGSGKSTLIQLLNALNYPTLGKIIYHINDTDYIIERKVKLNDSKKYRKILNKEFNLPFKLKPIRKHVGLVFQFPEYQLFEETVQKDIEFGPKNFDYSSEEIKQTVNNISKVMGIEEILQKNPFTLSGGQMRKVAIAGILASNPDILILDEPTVGLDPFAKQELMNILQQLNQEYHKSIIIITHDMEVVSKCAKRVIVLKGGKVQYDGSKTDLFKDSSLLQEYSLDYPEIIKILKELKTRLNIEIDEYQYTIEDAYQEIAKYYGDKDE